MANIIGLKEQQDALKKISKLLKELEDTNEFLSQQNSSGKYTIAFTDENNKKISTEFSCSKEEIDTLVWKYKEGMKNHILALAKEYRIGLDPEDNEILGLSVDVDF